MSSFTEAKLKTTEAFIDFRPVVDATVQARTRVTDGQGGHTWSALGSPVVLPKARFVPKAGTNRDIGSRVTADGTVVTPGEFLVYMPDAVVNVFDLITSVSHAGTSVYEVVFVHYFAGERVTCELWKES